MAKLYFRYGAMNCGKSTNLIQVAYNYEERGMNVLLAKPKIDTKDGDMVSSRLGIKRKVNLIIDEHSNFVDLVKEYIKDNKVHCILTDESQFFSAEQIDQLLYIAVHLNIPVICYGLRTDFLTNGFEGSQRLLLIAHSIEELKTICGCGRKAIFNARKVDKKFVFEGEQVAIDNQSSIEYIAMCGDCFLNLKENSKH